MFDKIIQIWSLFYESWELLLAAPAPTLGSELNFYWASRPT